jgi:hypothetical protein
LGPAAALVVNLVVVVSGFGRLFSVLLLFFSAIKIHKAITQFGPRVTSEMIVLIRSVNSGHESVNTTHTSKFLNHW